MKDVAGNDLAGCLNQLSLFMEQWGCQDGSWSEAVFVEDTSIVDKEAKCYIPRSALMTPEEYAPRFEELLGRGYSWLNMNATGILGQMLIITVTLPSYTTENKGETSVNYSGPPVVKGRTQWDATEYIILT